MSKTEDVERAFEQGIADMAEDGLITVLEIPEPSPVAFPAPSADFGRVTHVLMPNPRHRWWTFWRPKVICRQVQPLQIASGPTLQPPDALSGSAIPDAVLAGFFDRFRRQRRD